MFFEANRPSGWKSPKLIRIKNLENGLAIVKNDGLVIKRNRNL